jgi:hypothetical protein
MNIKYIAYREVPLSLISFIPKKTNKRANAICAECSIPVKRIAGNGVAKIIRSSIGAKNPELPYSLSFKYIIIIDKIWNNKFRIKGEPTLTPKRKYTAEINRTHIGEEDAEA